MPGRNPRERFWLSRPLFCEGGSFFFCGLFFLAQRRACGANVRQELTGVKCQCSTRKHPARNPKTHPHKPEGCAPRHFPLDVIVSRRSFTPSEAEGALLSQSFGGHFCAPWMTFAISRMSLRIRSTTTKGSGGKGSSRVPCTRPL